MKTTDMYAGGFVGEHRKDDLFHFYPSPQVVKMCGCDEAFHVRVTENDDPDSKFWGWWSNERNEFRHVYPGKVLVEICFPYGTDIMEKHGEGKLTGVDVEILTDDTEIT